MPARYQATPIHWMHLREAVKTYFEEHPRTTSYKIKCAVIGCALHRFTKRRILLAF